MKLFTLILLTLLMNTCAGRKELASNINSKKTEGVNQTIATQDMGLTLVYSATSRGFLNKISINAINTTYQLNFNEKPIIIPTNKNDWEALMETLKDLDYKRLTHLEAPSKAHQYDGAAQASFTIHYNEEDHYVAPTFDAGNPNKAIAATIKTMRSLIPSKK
jgi:hypothetical protein